MLLDTICPLVGYLCADADPSVVLKLLRDFHCGVAGIARLAELLKIYCDKIRI